MPPLAAFSKATPTNERASVFPVHMMTPTWVFPAYPLLLTAPFAGQLIAAAERSPDEGLVINNTAVALCAVTTQGTGCLIAFMISAAFIYRLMTQKLPRDMQRPGVVSQPHLSLFAINQTIPNIQLVHLHRSLWLHGRGHRPDRRKSPRSPPAQLPRLALHRRHRQGRLRARGPLAVGPEHVVVPRERRVVVEVRSEWQ